MLIGRPIQILQMDVHLDGVGEIRTEVSIISTGIPLSSVRIWNDSVESRWLVLNNSRVSLAVIRRTLIPSLSSG